MKTLPLGRIFSASALTLCLVHSGAHAQSAPITASATQAVPNVAPTVNLPDFTVLVEKVGPAVVNVRTTERVFSQRRTPGAFGDSDMAEFFSRFFGIPLPPADGSAPRGPGDQGGQGGQGSGIERNSGLGSGFILTSDGYVMTNAHVVDGADAIYVGITDRQGGKEEYKAKLIGADQRTDIAVLKINASRLPTVEQGDSDKVKVGEWVLAIGSPFGLDNTVTAGIVSAKGRDTGDYLPFIQSDVAVNPGNSGGPLINMRGQVIGINTQIYSRTGGFMGISFSIPIDEAMKVFNQLKTNGKVTRGRIAVQIGEVTREVADSLGRKDLRGALVSDVEAGGPADKAGLQAGDIVVRYNDTPVNRPGDLQRLVGDTKPGTTARLTVWRKGQETVLPVQVAELRSDQPSLAGQAPQEAAPEFNPLGIAAQDINADDRGALNIKGGVRVVDVDGPAAAAGLRPGDIVLRVGNVDIQNAKQFEALSQQLDARRPVALLVRRGNIATYVPVRPREKGKR